MINREEVRLSTAIGDWHLEVFARNNLVDLLRQVGPIGEAAREARQLVEELRVRPSTATDMNGMFASLIGILGEMDLVAEALAVAREALPIMRRSRDYYFADWVYLFWRRGQPDIAAQLLGAFDASSRKSDLPPQPNEQRLIASARAALEKELPADVLARHLAEGASLGSEKLLELLSESLNCQRSQTMKDTAWKPSGNSMSRVTTGARNVSSRRSQSLQWVRQRPCRFFKHTRQAGCNTKSVSSSGASLTSVNFVHACVSRGDATMASTYSSPS